ncbi:hypothetical protein CAPTEDRAFT_212841 [Capitella teleta]|uniref:lysoplasmalogenase n=1 Tax=Capitella teleta TaxID=283909 RepID=R7UXB9_CAPTE|nr:hypothetical protein CAPTEDRAFT_212841 [Capitella teleta]|eukprot:ELU11218.1 hypothetical protein CAPTEDRAFT_212841 [Capitella teleta]
MWILAVPFLVLCSLWMLKYNIFHLGSHRRPEESITTAVLKCFPILYLALIVKYTAAVDSEHAEYREWLFRGLIASMGGDFCLVWFKTLFLPGVFFFGTAHVFYIMAFQMLPIGPTSCWTPFLLYYLLMSTVILPRLPSVPMKVAVGVYVGIICCMGWRAAVMYYQHEDTPSAVGLWGALIFIVSDTLIAMSSWVMKNRIPKSTFLIMTTYYLGQALLATSVLLPAIHTLKTKKFMHL